MTQSPNLDSAEIVKLQQIIHAAIDWEFEIVDYRAIKCLLEEAGYIHRSKAVEYVKLCICDKGEVKQWDAINTWYKECEICHGRGIVLNDTGGDGQ